MSQPGEVTRVRKYLRRALQAGRPVASALPCDQPRCGVVALSVARSQMCYESIGTSDLPAVFIEDGSAPNVRPAW
ncbi:hypothetical protein GW17_00050457 [Ensete ventricosum]|nr:hypothetical protein GW17_00050457 [Ensete ventricosum]